jgi:hypothetical protein
MEIAPPIAENWTICIHFAFQKAGSVPDFDFLRNAAVTGDLSRPPAIPRLLSRQWRRAASQETEEGDEKKCRLDKY